MQGNQTVLEDENNIQIDDLESQVRRVVDSVKQLDLEWVITGDSDSFVRYWRSQPDKYGFLRSERTSGRFVDLERFNNKLKFVNYFITHPSPIMYLRSREGSIIDDPSVEGNHGFLHLHTFRLFFDRVEADQVTFNDETDLILYEIGNSQRLQEEHEKIKQDRENVYSDLKELSKGIDFPYSRSDLFDRLDTHIDHVYVPLFAEDEISIVERQSVEYSFPSEMRLHASIGYNPRSDPKTRLSQLGAFFDNGGRTKKQRFRDKTFHATDPHVNETLYTIFQKDPDDKVREEADHIREMMFYKA